MHIKVYVRNRWKKSIIAFNFSCEIFVTNVIIFCLTLKCFFSIYSEKPCPTGKSRMGVVYWTKFT